MKKSKWQKLKNFLTIFFFIIVIFLIAVLFFVREKYSNLSYEELIFHLNVPLTGSNTPFISAFFKEQSLTLLFGLIFVAFIFFLFSKMFRHSYIIKIKTKAYNKTTTKSIFIKDNLRYLIVIPLIIIVWLLFLMAKQINVDEYIYNINHPTKIYEKYYVDPSIVKLTFPENKRNLIYIYIESMESNYAHLPDGLTNTNNLIPNLEKLAKDNINFSDTDELGGAYQTSGVGWTMGGMVAQSAGLPLNIPVQGNDMELHKNFLPGAYTLGDILEKEGYNQMFMMGSIKEFGGRANYLKQHGNYKMYDLNTAIKRGKVPEDYYVWWGFEDSKLFEYAKEEITKLSEKDRPFNFQMLTANTHFDQGYLEEFCDEPTTNHFSDSVVCSDKQIYDFINWINDQPFYDNTTIILVGDHLVMSDYFYSGEVPLQERRVYNAFINTPLNGDNSKNRVFNTLDLYPTTLASLGVEIEGNKLGLGTNLFSSEQTLSELLGKDVVTRELKKESIFYNEKLLFEK